VGLAGTGVANQERLMAPENEYLDKDKFLELQYNTLRKEIETRQDRHFKLAAGALVIVPAVQLLSAGTNGAGTNGAAADVALLLIASSPLLVLSLYIVYFSEHLSIMRCGRYIKGQIEEPIKSAIPEIIGWETWLEEDPRRHETQQMIGFHLFYIPLYVIAAIAAASAVTRLLDSTAAFWSIAASWLTFVVYGIVGVLAGRYVWIEKQAMPTDTVNVEHR
jgi:hypothetical protein